MADETGQKQPSWIHWVLDHPKLAGFGAAIALAVAFTPKASMLASWVCLCVAVVFGIAMLLGFADKREWGQPSRIVSILFFLLLIVIFGIWLTDGKKTIEDWYHAMVSRINPEMIVGRWLQPRKGALIPPPSAYDRTPPPPTVPGPSQVPFPYPLISNGMTFGDSTTLICHVHDWPTTTADLRRGKLSLESLFHLSGDVWRIDSWTGTSQSGGPEVMHIDSPEWSNNDAPFKASGQIHLDRDNTVFMYHLGARNSGWGGYVILSKNGDKTDVEQGISGTVESEQKQQQHMKITIFNRWENGKWTITSRPEYHAPTSDRLRNLGIPEAKSPS